MSFDPKSVTLVRGDAAWAKHAPHPALADHVSVHWTIRTSEGETTLRTLPDACVDVTVDLSKKKPVAFVSGPQRRAETWKVRGPTHLVASRLQPGSAALLGVAVADLPVGWTPLARFVGERAARELARRVADARTDGARFGAMEAFLSARLLNRRLDARLAKALARVFATEGRSKVADLAKIAGAHVRTLTRLFEEHVGVSPKRFARIVRFQAALRALPGAPTLARAAAELGYHDQAHFVREVRELFGTTPRAALGLGASTS